MLPAPKTISPKNALGIFEISWEMYKQSDLDLFYETVAPNIRKGTGPEVDPIDLAGAPSADGAVGEAALDFDMAIPIIYPQGTELYQVGGGFHEFLEAVTESFSPGGGFSNIFPLPEYQAAALGTFFSAHDPGFPLVQRDRPQHPTLRRRRL